MRRLAIASDGNSPRELSVAAPMAAWEAQPEAPKLATEDLSEAFHQLRDPVCRFLQALGFDQLQAEEILQETFLRVCKKLPKEARQNMRAWVFRVAHNLARDEHRLRRRRQTEPLLDSINRADPAATPEEAVIAQQRRQKLIAALEQLPEHQRQCLHLRAEGLRYREIAEVLGAGVSTVAEWVQQALRVLSENCDEYK